MANTISGVGSFSGLGNFTVASASFAYSFNLTSYLAMGYSMNIFWGFGGRLTFQPGNGGSAAQQYIDLSNLVAGKVITVSGITGENSSLNNTTFEVSNIENSLDIYLVNGGSFVTQNAALGRPYNSTYDIRFGGDEGQLLPGLILSWN